MIMEVDIQADIAAVQSRIAEITGSSSAPGTTAAPGTDGFASILARTLNPNAAVRAVPAAQPLLPPAGTGLEQTLQPSPTAFIWPAAGPVTSPFGPRKDPLGSGYDFHPGMDIAAAEGSPIRAAAAGRVIQAGDDGGYGNVVVIDHGNGLTTRYAHCSQTFATVGQMVQAGDQIAAVGSTGRSTGPHLHFEVREGQRPVDPSTFLK